MDNLETTFEAVPWRKNATKAQVMQLKEQINSIVASIPQIALSKMVRSWHIFRLEQSGYWVGLGEKCVVDISIYNDTIHPATNVQGGRVTKNLEKIEIFVGNA